MKLHRTVPLDTRTLKESIQLLFPGFLTVTTGAFWPPSTRDHFRNELSRLSSVCVGSLFGAISQARTGRRLLDTGSPGGPCTSESARPAWAQDLS